MTIDLSLLIESPPGERVSLRMLIIFDIDVHVEKGTTISTAYNTFNTQSGIASSNLLNVYVNKIGDILLPWMIPFVVLID